MKVGAIIGRFQPFHLGHATLLERAIKENDQTIIVLGSANRSRSVKNPFTAAERKQIITDWLLSEFEVNPWTPKKCIPHFVESPDNLYKEWTWKSEIVRRVNDAIPSGADAKIRLYGHSKDSSSYYLREFPEWELVEVDNHHEVDATGIRLNYFEDGIISNMYLPDSTVSFLREFKETPTYTDLLEDWAFFKWEKNAFGGYPFPDTLNFMCSDAVVVCKGHILLIQRKNAPGKNTWALPGGFKNADESFKDACVRELIEETNLRVPEKVLRGSIRNSMMFDDPSRSIGIQRVSMGFHIELNTDPNGSLPPVRPASDAYKAQWIELSDALSMNLFEDHLDIIKMFV